MTAACRGPTAAEHALPPSNRKIGRKLRPHAIRPEYPTKKSGWTGIGWASGNIIALEAIQDVKVPARKLDLKIMAGSTGKLAKEAGEARTVRRRLAMMHPIEAIVVAKGPLRAKSNNAARLDGNDRMGVMQPNIPKANDGTGTGGPISIRRHLATK